MLDLHKLTHIHTHQELEATVESLKESLQEKEEKNSKMVKTLKAARTRLDTLKTEKDQVLREFIQRGFSGGGRGGE